MNYYPMLNDTIILEPILLSNREDNCTLLCQNWEFIQNSKIYTNELNLSDSSKRFIDSGSLESYWFYNRLYVIFEQDGETARGIIGLKDIDWIQRRGELVIVMDQEAVKTKLCYKPLKLLLVPLFKEWNIRRIWTRVVSTDSRTITVLKGFGFAEEGLLKKELLVDGEYIDIKVLGLIKEEFHYNG